MHLPVEILKAINYTKLLEDVKKDLYKIYTDIAEVHFTSAIQAFKASMYSKCQEDEIRNAISHLRDVFNIYDRIRNKKVKTTFLGLITEEEYLFTDAKKYEISRNLCKISSIISMSYALIGEGYNAKDLEEKGLSGNSYYSSYSVKTMRYHFFPIFCIAY